MVVGTSRKLNVSTECNFLFVIMAQIVRNRIEIEQELILETDTDEAISSESESELDEHTVSACDNNNATEI
jgi:hypothetical protein